MTEKVKILQVISAPAGMRAIFEDDRGGEYEENIVALGLVESVGVRDLVPLSMDELGCVHIATSEDNFEMLLFDGDRLRKEEPVDLNDPESLRHAYAIEDAQQFRHQYGLE